MSVTRTCQIYSAQEARSYIEQMSCYTNQSVFDPLEETNTQLKPLEIEGYRAIYDRWKGDPLFKQQNGCLVHLLNIVSPSLKSKVQAVIPFEQPKVQILNKLTPQSSVFKAGTVAANIFPNIKHFVGIALGMPLTIDAIEPPPPGILAKTRVKAFFPSDKSSDGFEFRYGDLIPMTLEECKKLFKWDGLPVFKDAEGNPVRPFIATLKHTKKYLYLASQVNLTPILGITINPYGKRPRNIPMLLEKDFSKSFEMIPLFDLPLEQSLSCSEDEKKLVH